MTTGPLAPAAVVEPRLPNRVRRPADALRLTAVLALLAVTVGLGAAAAGTAGALERDLSLAAGGLPLVLLSILGYAGGVGVVALALLCAADLFRRGDVTSLVVGFAAAAAGATLAGALEWLVQNGRLADEITVVLTRPLIGGGRTTPASEVVVATVALLTASAASRRVTWPLGSLVVGSSVVTAFLGGTATAMAMTVSLLLGWAVGLVPRLLVGVPSTRPDGVAVAAALAEGGVPLRRLEYRGPGPLGRDYVGTPAGAPGAATLDVEVFDADAFGASSALLLLRRLRLRGPSTRGPSLTVRTSIEHRTLIALALERAGVRAPRALAVRSVGGGSAVVAWERPGGTPVGDDPHPIDDAELTSLFEVVARLRRAGIAHRALNERKVLVDEDGRAVLAGLGHGDVAAADLSLRLDLAQMLVTAALASAPGRAVATAARVLGPDAVIDALPLLQPVGLDRVTRAALRGHRDVLDEVQVAVARLAPARDLPQPVELRRVTPRFLVALTGGTVAAYVLLGQLTGADLGLVLRNADWRWAALLLAFVVLTFTGASLVLSGAVLAPLRFRRTYLAQLAVAFSGLVAPGLVGTVTVNTRYLHRAGVPPGVAAGSIGLGQLAQFSSYVTLLVLSGVAAGIGPRASFTPPPGAVVGVSVLVVAAVGVASLPQVRRLVSRRLLGRLDGVVPNLLGVLRRPAKVAELLGGALLLDMSYVAALFCATRAFGATTPLAAVAVTYFAGAIIGSAVPTPGGLGGVEAALSAGLVAVGTSSGVAVSAVLLYRLATYWAPIPVGWLAVSHLQKVRAL